MNENAWNYPAAAGHTAGSDLTGFKVEALDGGIGKVGKHTEDVDAAFLVVDTGPWIFGREVLLPAGTVTRVDAVEERIHVDRTKEQIKDAPSFHSDQHLSDSSYRDLLGSYYWPPRM
ncbi:PRC-barrel domain-containing protein [Streptomyces yaizuensis]|uniref:PRC-barrel domain-containing protein n=1 Tax=Streptomyces yaizuensis TaxID=2989713 RepID=A0ABQ5NSS9_9ACTN|nr:PRC-barrel domain-containing protein [Streptomyces sp. YSPA8]GLF93066.1 PRC-barrel domain-containing protein [Streptomyces sp. YSPA8]